MFSIGNVNIDGYSVLAPLAGITDLPYRLICKRLGASLVYTEMISAEGLIRDGEKTVLITESVPEERPVSFQIFGSKPDSMREAARMLSGRGADIIDINMGCPVRKVLRSGSGSALLCDMDKARSVIRAVVEGSSAPVTIKIRTGWHATDFIAADYAKMAEAEGVAAIAVHGRYARQGFSGHADWSAITRAKEAVSIPVIGNGDVHLAEDAKRMTDETGCDAVMIGRGALGNPWLFGEVEEYMRTGTVPPRPTYSERGELLIEHLRFVVSRTREFIGVRQMRKHGAWYAKGMHGAAEFRRFINHAESAAEFEEAVVGFFMDYSDTE
jgi:tRNA-dihydrouridine synthase B